MFLRFVFVFLFSMNAFAAVPPTQLEIPPAKTPSPNTVFDMMLQRTGSYVVATRDGVSDQVILLANKIDRLFGDDRALDEYYNSSLKVTTSNLYNAKTGTNNFGVSTSLNLSLPNLRATEKAIQQYWTRKPNDPAGEQKITPEEFKEVNPWDFGSELGVRWVNPPSPFAKARANRNYLTGTVVHHLRLEYGWDSEYLWTSLASLTSDYAYNPYFLLRFVNRGDWAISDDIFRTAHGPSWIYTFEDRSLVSFDLRLGLRSYDNAIYTDVYSAGFKYRTGFKKVDWIFMEITPAYTWTYSSGFTPTPTINLTFDFIYGKKEQ
ncbi:MAG: hypothetical protein J7501_05040 [Bdellovibrio sp.]|nr:hypothetical protein [Bdellovibrio sp.]